MKLTAATLEANAQTKFNLTRSIALRAQHSPTGRVRQVKCGIRKNNVVENVQEQELHFGADAFRDPDVFLHAEVCIPIGETANGSESCAVAPRIDAQNRRSEQS